MKIIIYCISVVMLLIMQGCFLIERQCFNTYDQTARFSNTFNPGIKGKLNMDGYWLLDRPYYLNMFALYDDGTYYKLYVSDSTEYVGKSITNLDEHFRIDYSWEEIGLFKIINDTLIVNSYWSDWNKWYLTVDKYEIIDSCTLRKLESTTRLKSGECYIKKINRIYRFVKASPLPSKFESIPKRKKWLWDNETDRKNFKKKNSEYWDSVRASWINR